MDKGAYQNTEAGTPQGGVISPLLANIALHGLEEAVMEIIPTKKQKTELTVVRYADDFVILHKDREIINQARKVVEQWLTTKATRQTRRKMRTMWTGLQKWRPNGSGSRSTEIIRRQGLVHQPTTTTRLLPRRQICYGRQ